MLFIRAGQVDTVAVVRQIARHAQPVCRRVAHSSSTSHIAGHRAFCIEGLWQSGGGHSLKALPSGR
eukprot:3718239-Alexandrium_andersonii.AAC.1